jgi:dihydroorotase
MLHYVQAGKISIEKVVEKMCHANAVLYDVAERGFIREGYYADLAIVNMDAPYTVSPNNI